MRNTDFKIEEVFEYIKKCRQENGYSPSVRDIRDAVNIKSTSTVQSYINRLIDEGRLVKSDGKSRSLRTENFETLSDTKFLQQSIYEKT